MILLCCKTPALSIPRFACKLEYLYASVMDSSRVCLDVVECLDLEIIGFEVLYLIDEVNEIHAKILELAVYHSCNGSASCLIRVLP